MRDLEIPERSDINMIVLVTGGSGSGKSAYAEKRVTELAAEASDTVYYLATMEVFGEESRKKVKRHIDMRRGKGMLTIEKTKNIEGALKEIKEGGAAILLEDMGNLTANEMFADAENERGGYRPADLVAEKITAQLWKLSERCTHLVVVTNNVFEDGIAYEESTAQYIRALGKINALVAQRADEVTEVVAGIPLYLK